MQRIVGGSGGNGGRYHREYSGNEQMETTKRGKYDVEQVLVVIDTRIRTREKRTLKWSCVIIDPCQNALSCANCETIVRGRTIRDKWNRISETKNEGRFRSSVFYVCIVYAVRSWLRGLPQRNERWLSDGILFHPIAIADCSLSYANMYRNSWVKSQYHTFEFIMYLHLLGSRVHAVAPLNLAACAHTFVWCTRRRIHKSKDLFSRELSGYYSAKWREWAGKRYRSRLWVFLFFNWLRLQWAEKEAR